MRIAFTLLLLLCAAASFAQTDTLVVAGETYSGKLTKNYADRVAFNSNGTDYLVMKDRIDRMNIRNKVIINGVVGYEYVSQKSLLNIGSLPEFKDHKYWLRASGIQGIIATSLILAGGSLAGIGAASRNTDASQLVTVGSALASAGLCIYIPTFIFVLKAGKTKSYRML